MYEIGDYIMHESSGVCKVTDISEKALSGTGSEKLYYSLEPVFDKGAQIITPVESARRIRDISTKAEIKELLDEVPTISIIKEENNRARTEKFKEQMSLFEPVSLASVVKSIYLHQQMRLAAGKKAMSSDERVMEVAERRLFEEMAFALDTDIDDVKTTFFLRLKSERDEIVSSVGSAS
ncbi:MAG: CarD family transcriptional regulator [Lachnospiraceae bacterium]|nr:CarD family transcriptional regulator [Lachnospiraceae bacterium]